MKNTDFQKLGNTNDMRPVSALVKRPDSAVKYGGFKALKK